MFVQPTPFVLTDTDIDKSRVVKLGDVVIRSVAIRRPRIGAFHLLGGHKSEPLLSGDKIAVRFAALAADRVKLAIGAVAGRDILCFAARKCRVPEKSKCWNVKRPGKERCKPACRTAAVKVRRGIPGKRYVHLLPFIR